MQRPIELKRNKKEFSYVPLPVGLVSEEASTCVGKDGYLFLIRGSNQLTQQYGTSLDDPKVIADQEAWLSLINNRKINIENYNAKFLQIIIPEKTSVLSDLVPLDFVPPSAWYKAIVSGLERPIYPNSMWLDGFSVLTEHVCPASLFRKLDSHLSTQGAVVVMNALLGKIGEEKVLIQPIDHQTIEPADLGRKFSKNMDKEPTQTLRPADVQLLSTDLQEVDSYLPEGGKHFGMRRVFRRPSAPIDLKVVAFANSFFAWGQSPSCLTWWCARYFKEFHFIWSPEIDYSYVENHRPDLVIAQTIERFLTKPPSS